MMSRVIFIFFSTRARFCVHLRRCVMCCQCLLWFCNSILLFCFAASTMLNCSKQQMLVDTEDEDADQSSSNSTELCFLYQTWLRKIYLLVLCCVNFTIAAVAQLHLISDKSLVFAIHEMSTLQFYITRETHVCFRVGMGCYCKLFQDRLCLMIGPLFWVHLRFQSYAYSKSKVLGSTISDEHIQWM